MTTTLSQTATPSSADNPSFAASQHLLAAAIRRLERDGDEHNVAEDLHRIGADFQAAVDLTATVAHAARALGLPATATAAQIQARAAQLEALLGQHSAAELEDLASSCEVAASRAHEDGFGITAHQLRQTDELLRGFAAMLAPLSSTGQMA